MEWAVVVVGGDKVETAVGERVRRGCIVVVGEERCGLGRGNVRDFLIFWN